MTLNPNDIQKQHAVLGYVGGTHTLGNDMSLTLVQERVLKFRIKGFMFISCMLWSSRFLGICNN